MTFFFLRRTTRAAAVSQWVPSATRSRPGSYRCCTATRFSAAVASRQANPIPHAPNNKRESRSSNQTALAIKPNLETQRNNVMQRCPSTRCSAAAARRRQAATTVAQQHTPTPKTLATQPQPHTPTQQHNFWGPCFTEMRCSAEGPSRRA